jgi:hypothetical protein
LVFGTASIILLYLNGLFYAWQVECAAIFYGGGISMKKYMWLIAGIVALVLSTMVVLNLSSSTSMIDDCLPDGSCCEDVNNCTCG